MPSNKKKRSKKKRVDEQKHQCTMDELQAMQVVMHAVSERVAHQSTIGHDLKVSDPPSYAERIDGIPVATKCTEGFRSLGKLGGALRNLWQAGCKAITDSIMAGNYAMFSQEIPLFTLLSPHHRIRLLREVAVGLLCEDTPLPPDTLWHYVAFLAPLQYVNDSGITIELEEEKSYTQYDEETLEPVAAEVPQQKQSGEELWERDKKNDDVVTRMAEGSMRSLELKAMQKKAKIAKKSEPSKSTALLVSEVQKAADDAFGTSDWGAGQLAYQYREIRRLLDVSPAHSERFYISQRGNLNEMSWLFDWRRALREFLVEYWNECDPIIQRLSLDKVLIPALLETNDVVWKRAFSNIPFIMMNWPSDNTNLFQCLIYGPVDEGEDYDARSHLIHRLVRRSSKVFRETWTPESSAADFRYLAVLMHKDIMSPNSLGSLERVDRLEDNDASRRWCQFGYSLWRLTDEERERKKDALRESMSVMSAVDLATRLGALRDWSWAHLWHEEMLKDPTRYKSPDARVRAVAASGTKALIGSDDIAKVSWEHSPCKSQGIDLVSMSPAEAKGYECEDECCDSCNKSRKRNDVELRACGGCGVIKYCSEDCQYDGWKVHRKVCKELKKIVEGGKEAGNLPLDVFEEKARELSPCANLLSGKAGKQENE